MNSKTLIIYLVIVFIVIMPLLTNRYIFSLDSIPAINDRKIIDIYYGKDMPIYGGDLPLQIISIFISTDKFQKMIIFAFLLLSGYSIYELLNKIEKINSIYASFLYMFNPFTYVSIISGQWFISYAILPFLIKQFINLLEIQQKKEIIKFIFILSIIGFNIHIFIISLIIMIIIFLFWFNKNRDFKIIKFITISIILFIILNSYWIMVAMTAKNTILDNIGKQDFDIFSPRESLLDIAAMYSFWGGGYLYSKDFLPGWQILYFIIFSLSIIGFLSYYKDDKMGVYVLAFGTIGILGYVLSSGIKYPFVEQIYRLFENTILVKGFRDSHKFTIMICLAYAVLGALGIKRVESMLNLNHKV